MAVIYHVTALLSIDLLQLFQKIKKSTAGNAPCRHNRQCFCFLSGVISALFAVFAPVLTSAPLQALFPDCSLQSSALGHLLLFSDTVHKRPSFGPSVRRIIEGTLNGWIRFRRQRAGLQFSDAVFFRKRDTAIKETSTLTFSLTISAICCWVW